MSEELITLKKTNLLKLGKRMWACGRERMDEQTAQNKCKEMIESYKEHAHDRRKSKPKADL